MLIKNLLENRTKGWEKTKKQNESGPKKVEDLRQELARKAREEEQARYQAEQEEMSYLDQGYGGGRGGQKGGRDRQGTYQPKKSGYKQDDGYGASQGPAGGDRRNRGSVKQLQTQKSSGPSSGAQYVKKQSSVNQYSDIPQPKEAKYIEDSDMGKKAVENFATFVSQKNEAIGQIE